MPARPHLDRDHRHAQVKKPSLKKPTYAEVMHQAILGSFADVCSCSTVPLELKEFVLHSSTSSNSTSTPISRQQKRLYRQLRRRLWSGDEQLSRDESTLVYALLSSSPSPPTPSNSADPFQLGTSYSSTSSREQFEYDASSPPLTLVSGGMCGLSFDFSGSNVGLFAGDSPTVSMDELRASVRRPVEME